MLRGDAKGNHEKCFGNEQPPEYGNIMKAESGGVCHKEGRFLTRCGLKMRRLCGSGRIDLSGPLLRFVNPSVLSQVSHQARLQSHPQSRRTESEADSQSWRFALRRAERFLSCAGL